MAKKSVKKKSKYTNQERYDFLVKVGKAHATQLKKKSTPEEKIVLEYLKEFGFAFEFQKPVIVKCLELYILDFLLIDHSIFIEIDGSGHFTKQGIKKDNLRTKRLRKEGYEPIRLTNRQVNTFSKEAILEIINNKIKLLNSNNTN